MLPKLLEVLGDKIAVVRVSVVKLIALVLVKRQISLKFIGSELISSMGSKNWF